MRGRFLSRGVAVALLSGLVAGCGLHPLYAGGSQGAVARGLAAVDVPAIQGKTGWLMRAQLQDALSAAGDKAPPRYRLDVRLDDQLEGLGLLSNNTVGRERRTLKARFQLVDLQNDRVVLDESTQSDSGINVVTNEYATVAAEETALENLTQVVANQIVIEVARRLREGPETMARDAAAAEPMPEASPTGMAERPASAAPAGVP